MQVKSGSQLPLNLNVDNETRFQNFFEFGIESELVRELKGEFSWFICGERLALVGLIFSSRDLRSLCEREPSIFLPLKKS